MDRELLEETTYFQDRVDAGRQLAARLSHYRNQNPVVLALPRGGVVIGYEVARALQAPLEVLAARKLGAPQHPELGIGAIAPGGVLVLDDQAVRWLGISDKQLDQVIAKETQEMQRRQQLYQGDRPLPPLQDRIAIVVDDGLATGVTARAALRSVRQQQPRRLILAVPVCAPEAAQDLQAEADEVICVSSPSNFRAVGLWYRDFTQVSDAEVLDLLKKAE